MIESEEEAGEFADFALWTAWFSHADRPGGDHSYTNDWPYQPGAGNDATGAAMIWSVVAMILLVGGAGAGILLYRSIELPEPSAEGIEVPEPGQVEVFPSQRAALRFLPVAAGLFLAQVFLGGLLAHLYVERAGFFGIEEILGVHVLQVLPFALAKTWHIDLGVLWIAATWLGAGLFLPPLLTGHEPEGQSTYVTALLAGIAVVAVGGLGGIWLGSQGYLDGQLWWLLGNEGLEYLEVGKLWQGGLLVGFVVWAALCVRGFRPLLDREPPFGLAHMILYAGGSIALLFVAGFLFTPGTNIAVTEFWRWWVVHMWVEGAFEFFIVASGVWNFVGAGVLGFFINLPLVNYYEHGTYLTVGHAHAAMFGAFGFLALGMATYMLQLAVDPARWDGTWLRRAFWLWNVGLALMVFVSLLPVGFLQLEAAFTGSYAAARSLAFYERPLV
jgi:nitric oxide reductase subunit B